jgi:hypothetical protein
MNNVPFFSSVLVSSRLFSSAFLEAATPPKETPEEEQEAEAEQNTLLKPNQTKPKLWMAAANSKPASTTKKTYKITAHKIPSIIVSPHSSSQESNLCKKQFLFHFVSPPPPPSSSSSLASLFIFVLLQLF